MRICCCHRRRIGCISSVPVSLLPSLILFLLALLFVTALSRGWIYFTWDEPVWLELTGEPSVDARIRQLAASARRPSSPGRLNLSSRCEGRIPLLLHQIYATDTVPELYRHSIASCIRRHPEFVYVLWTDKEARGFVARRFPDYLAMFDGYGKALQRSDALRYFILYHFGGVYIDMDVHCLQPMDKLVATETCFFDQERPEQTQILHGIQYSVMNSVIGCVKKHPFLERVIQNLPDTKNVEDIISSTGPIYLTQQYQQYISQAPRSSSHSLRLLSPEVFSPLLDRSAVLKSVCDRLLYPTKIPETFNRLYPYRQHQQLTDKSFDSRDSVSLKLAACRKLSQASYSQLADRWLTKKTLGIHLFLHLGYPEAVKHDRRRPLKRFQAGELLINRPNNGGGGPLTPTELEATNVAARMCFA